MLAYRVRREFQTKAFGTLRVGQLLDSEEAASMKNLPHLLKSGLLVISEIAEPAGDTSPKKGKRK